MNCSCGLPLAESISMTLNGQRLKSCPRCSTIASRHSFHPEDHFGMRNMERPLHPIVLPGVPCRTRGATTDRNVSLIRRRSRRRSDSPATGKAGR